MSDIFKTETRNFDTDNGRGKMLSARLEHPKDADASCYAIFANCFTCEKDFFAPKRVSRALAARGIATVRFDFTGLGESEGEFSNTNFTTNLQDMSAIAERLNQDFGKYPNMLLGHSLGGGAAIGLADMLNEQGHDVRTVATIGSPKDPRHVMRHFEEHDQIMERDGQIEISVAGRKYILKKQFVEDVKSHDIENKTKHLNAHLYIFHDPEDDMVKFENAEELFSRAPHAHLVTMEGAGHMLGGTEYTDNVADILASWHLDGLIKTGPHIQHK